MTHNELISRITNTIKTNGKQEITAQVLQDVLLDMADAGGDTQSSVEQLESKADNIYEAIALEVTTTDIQGEVQKGYVNDDSGMMFFIDTDISTFYFPVVKGKKYKVHIPKTSRFGSTYGFAYNIASGNKTETRYNAGNNVVYSNTIEAPIDGYMLLCYMPTSGTPTASIDDVASKEITTLKKYIGTIFKGGVDAAEGIPFSRDVYDVGGRYFETLDIIAAKNFIPVELGSSDYVYDSVTGVPNNYVLFAAFNSEKKMVCAVTNRSGAYIKTANIRDYVPSALWGVVKYLCVNCYSTNLETAKITVKNSSDFILEESEIPYDVVAGKTIPVQFSIVNSSIVTDYIPVEITKDNKLYLTSSGYFNIYASNTLTFYDDLKHLIKSVPAGDIAYLVNDTSDSRKLVVCINDYIEDGDNVRYIKLSNYTSAKGDNFINLYYEKNGFSKTHSAPNVYKGKKLLTYGDSVTEGITWQHQLALMKGLDWDERTAVRANETLIANADVYHYEVASGTNKDKVCFAREDGTYYYFADDGSEVNIAESEMVSVHNRSTGVSGSLLTARPQNGLNYRCVYKRIQEAQSFNPDVIVIYGTYNDLQKGVSTSESLKTSFYGTKNDSPYYGLPKDGVTFASSLKGIFEILARTCPMSKVVYVGIYTFVNHPTSKAEWESAAADCKYQNDLAKDICAQYAIPFVDMQSEFGCNYYNHMKLMADSSPHPNRLGGDRTAEIIAAKI